MSVGRRRGLARSTDDDRILPLINVVFLLLIFFLLAGRLAAGDPFAVTPPTSRSEGSGRTAASNLLLAADGRLALDGVVVDEATLRRMLSERPPAGGEQEVSLRADATVEAQRVVRLLDMLRRLGIERVRLMTLAGPS